VLAEPLPALTDLALGAVTVLLACRLRGAHGAVRQWRNAFWWFGIAALAGAVHHGVVVRSETAAEVSWAAISMVVVVAVSFVLAATVADVLGPGRARAFWVLRSVGLVLYAIVALTGHAGIAGIMACEGVTMVCVVGLWLLAAHRRHERAVPVLVAIVVSGAAAGLKAVDPAVLRPLALDPTSAYHLAQIAGTVLLFAAVAELPYGGLRRLTAARASG
jgi:hypothetical protein